MIIIDRARLIGDRYSVGDRLGSGGMAEVHDGFDHRLGRHVAIKVLRPELAADSSTRARFEVEARAAAGLSHPNIVAIYDVGEENGAPYLVMERLPGRSFADRIHAGTLDPEVVRRVAIDVLAALGYAHAAGIVHRDVKPANILFTGEDTAKLCDFGIAKTLPGFDRPIATRDLTVTGHLLGTPAYMAPERLHGEAATPSSDIYSLGVVLYEALAGTKPFIGPTALATAAAVERGDHRPLAEARPGLPAGLAANVEMAMDPHPDRRFASVGEMRQALITGWSGSPTARVPDGRNPTEPLTRPMAMPVPDRPGSVWRNRRRLGWLAVLLLASGALVWLLVSSIGGSAGHRPPATVPTTSATSITTAPTTPPTTTPSTTSPPTTAATPAAPAAPTGPKPKPAHHGKD